MSAETSSSSATKAHQFNKILNQRTASSSSRIRTVDDVEEALKKLRRLVLVNGIPSDVVSVELGWIIIDVYLTGFPRTLRFALGSGSFCYASMIYQLTTICDTLLGAHAMYARKSGTTPSGRTLQCLSIWALSLIEKQNSSNRSDVQGEGSRRYAS